MRRKAPIFFPITTNVIPSLVRESGLWHKLTFLSYPGMGNKMDLVTRLPGETMSDHPLQRGGQGTKWGAAWQSINSGDARNGIFWPTALQPISDDSENYTLMFWGNPDSASNMMMMSYARTDANPWPQIEFNVNEQGVGVLEYIEFRSNYKIRCKTGNEADGAMHCFVAIRNGDDPNAKIFKDGVDVTSSTSGNDQTVTWSGSDARVAVGGQHGSSVNTKGREVLCAAIWDRTLSVEEIERLAADPYILIRPEDYYPAYIPAVVGDVTAPTAGTVALTGIQPSVTLQIAISPTAGTVDFAGVQPTVEIGYFADPTVGTLNLSGATPTVTLALQIAPTAGTLALTGITPTVELAITIAPTAGTVNLLGAGVTRDVATPDVVRAPTAGTVALTGIQPTVQLAITIAPTAGTVNLAGVQPGVRVGFTPAPTAGTLALTGIQPSVTLAISIAPTAGTLALTGIQPTAQIALNISPAAGTLAFTGIQPTVQKGILRAPTAGTVSLSGVQPALALQINIAPAAGTIDFAGATPGVLVVSEGDRSPVAGTIALTGAQPTLALDMRIAVTAGTVDFAGATPTVTVGVPGVSADNRGKMFLRNVGKMMNP